MLRGIKLENGKYPDYLKKLNDHYKLMNDDRNMLKNYDIDNI